MKIIGRVQCNHCNEIAYVFADQLQLAQKIEEIVGAGMKAFNKGMLGVGGAFICGVLAGVLLVLAIR